MFGYGTNTGIKAAAAGVHGHSEDDLRYVRRRFLSAETARAMAVQIANATFAVRSEQVWGTGVHGGGIRLDALRRLRPEYLHPVALALRRSRRWSRERCATTMEVEANYTDSHGHVVGFAFTYLLGFDLLPRIKRINHVKLYRSGPGEALAWPQLAPAMMGRVIRWDLVSEQYDQMISYVMAIRTGTALTEAILRRFAEANAIHPTYQAMLEVGRAQKTLFVARYLRDRDLQREIHDGLNVAEGWNGGNQVLSTARAMTSRPTGATSRSCRWPVCTCCRPPAPTSTRCWCRTSSPDRSGATRSRRRIDAG